MCSACVETRIGAFPILGNAIAEMIPTIAITTTRSRRVNPPPRISLRIALRERGEDTASSVLSDPRKRAGAFRLPAPVFCFGKYAAGRSTLGTVGYGADAGRLGRSRSAIGEFAVGYIGRGGVRGKE